LYSNDMKDDDGKDIDVKGQYAMYVVLEDEDGRTYYQEVDYQGSRKQSDLNQYMDKFDNLADQTEENKQITDIYEKNKMSAEVKAESTAKIPIDHQTFNANPNFKAQVAEYDKYGGGNSRSNLMKAFYMMNFDINTTGENAPGYDIDTEINENAFGSMFGSMGLEMSLKDPRVSDFQILSQVQQLLARPEHNTDKGMTKNNMIFYTKLSNYLTNVVSGAKQKPKAKDGADFGFTPGSEWEVVKDFKGNSHEEGGIDVSIDKKGVSINQGKVKAKKGIVFNGKHFQL